MPRKGHIKKHPCLPDTRFGSQAVTKFVNSLMRQGKKSVAERIMYDALDIAAQKLNTEPFVEVRPRRVGGATYQVPVEVPAERAQVLTIRWMLNYSRAKKGMPMAERLAREFRDAYKGEGNSIKKKEDTHKMAEANRAFAHYRW